MRIHCRRVTHNVPSIESSHSLFSGNVHESVCHSSISGLPAEAISQLALHLQSSLCRVQREGPWVQHTHTQQQMSSTVSLITHTPLTWQKCIHETLQSESFFKGQAMISLHIFQLMLRSIISMLTLNYSLHVMLSSVDIFSPISAVREAIPPNTKCLALILWTERVREISNSSHERRSKYTHFLLVCTKVETSTFADLVYSRGEQIKGRLCRRSQFSWKVYTDRNHGHSPATKTLSSPALHLFCCWQLYRHAPATCPTRARSTRHASVHDRDRAHAHVVHHWVQNLKFCTHDTSKNTDLYTSYSWGVHHLKKRGKD